MRKRLKHKLIKSEINEVLYSLMKKNNLASFSVTHIELSGREESLKVYLFFSDDKKTYETMDFLNRNIFLIKKHLINLHNLPRIPWIKFFLTDVFFPVDEKDLR